MEWVAKKFVAVIALTMTHVTMSVECVLTVVKTGIMDQTVRTVRNMYRESRTWSMGFSRYHVIKQIAYYLDIQNLPFPTNDLIVNAMFLFLFNIIIIKVFHFERKILLFSFAFFFLIIILYFFLQILYLRFLTDGSSDFL